MALAFDPDRVPWTGPLEGDTTEPRGEVLVRPVPPERWPYGPPAFHEDCCHLREGGLYCDCKASDNSDTEYGEGA